MGSSQIRIYSDKRVILEEASKTKTTEKETDK